MATDNSATWITGYFKNDKGEVVEVRMATIDLRDACYRYPDQYSDTPDFGHKKSDPKPVAKS